MQRRKFLTSAVTATALNTTTNLINAEPQRSEQAEKPVIVKAGEARFDKRTPFRGINPNDLKVSSKDINGTLSIFEYTGPAISKNSPTDTQ